MLNDSRNKMNINCDFLLEMTSSQLLIIDNIYLTSSSNVACLTLLFLLITCSSSLLLTYIYNRRENGWTDKRKTTSKFPNILAKDKLVQCLFIKSYSIYNLGLPMRLVVIIFELDFPKSFPDSSMARFTSAVERTFAHLQRAKYHR